MRRRGEKREWRGLWASQVGWGSLPGRCTGPMRLEVVMDLGLQGKVAVVAASSKGLGKAVATTLAREGALVTINGRDAATLRVAGEEIREATGADVLQVMGDMTNPVDVN